jgi:Family of unknown function (DUF5989)
MSFLVELWQFLRLVFGRLVVLTAGSAFAPFVYTLL